MPAAILFHTLPRTRREAPKFVRSAWCATAGQGSIELTEMRHVTTVGTGRARREIISPAPHGWCVSIEDREGINVYHREFTDRDEATAKYVSAIERARAAGLLVHRPQPGNPEACTCGHDTVVCQVCGRSDVCGSKALWVKIGDGDRMGNVGPCCAAGFKK